MYILHLRMMIWWKISGFSGIFEATVLWVKLLLKYWNNFLTKRFNVACVLIIFMSLYLDHLAIVSSAPGKNPLITNCLAIFSPLGTLIFLSGTADFGDWYTYVWLCARSCATSILEHRWTLDVGIRTGLNGLSFVVVVFLVFVFSTASWWITHREGCLSPIVLNDWGPSSTTPCSRHFVH